MDELRSDSSTLKKREACLVCGAISKCVSHLMGKDGLTYQVLQCRNCGLAFTVPLSGEPVAYDQLYDKDFYSQALWAETTPLREELERRVVQRQLEFLREFLPGPGRMLDVGCGDGVHLKLFREAGWEVEGTEISSYAASWVREHYGVEVFVGGLMNAPYPEGSFDMVQMRHVIEHLPHPQPTVRKAWEVLKPGGFLCIDTPTIGLVSRMECAFGSLAACEGLQSFWRNRAPDRDSQGSWGIICPPEHNLCFTPKAMELLFERTGFRSVLMKTTYRGHPDHYPSKFLLTGERMGKRDRIVSVMDRLGGCFGRGDILVAYGRKG